MDKPLCLKFLAHLHKYSGDLLKKDLILAQDVAYLNNEIEVFRKRMDAAQAAAYDTSGALAKVTRVEEETGTGKAVNLSMTLIKHKFPLLKLFWGEKDEGHQIRYERIAEFRERIKKIIFVLDMA